LAQKSMILGISHIKFKSIILGEDHHEKKFKY